MTNIRNAHLRNFLSRNIMDYFWFWLLSCQRISFAAMHTISQRRIMFPNTTASTSASYMAGIKEMQQQQNKQTCKKSSMHCLLNWWITRKMERKNRKNKVNKRTSECLRAPKVFSLFRLKNLCRWFLSIVSNPRITRYSKPYSPYNLDKHWSLLLQATS